MNKLQLASVIREVTRDMDRYSPLALTAILMIIAHESDKGKYLFQLGGGPALGVVQMEPDTHDDTWKHSDSIHENAEKLGLKEDVTQLYKSLEYSIFMARQRLLMDTNPLPSGLKDMSKYLKEYWNAGGSAEELDYYHAFVNW